MAAELKSKFEGKWVHDRSENLGAFLEKAGVGMIKRNLVQQLSPTMVISVEGETITVSITAGPKTNKSSFKLGEDYAVEGEQKGTATTTYEGGKMKTVIKPNDSKLTGHTILRDICPKGQLVQTMETGGVTATRYFNKA
ncbi:myelin P2 protein-like [Ruditapes philippinarum]|uniref:myelin P2 protein-like n=1 Tax=Ruditapes philippinarum TaxID=129788 RepID=UPI00295BDB91|nr:myelin P2 protein-like [Ruditapes philippinarum]